MRAAGRRVGRYTSPHLARIEERVAIDGESVAPGVLDAALGRVFTAVDALVAGGTLAAVPTFFEVSTAAAFLAFADADVDVAVVEVGLGGRHDATNVIVPAVSAITNIEFDHERHLGHTIAAIAAEKAGIAKAGVPLVIGAVSAGGAGGHRRRRRRAPAPRWCRCRTARPRSPRSRPATPSCGSRPRGGRIRRCGSASPAPTRRGTPRWPCACSRRSRDGVALGVGPDAVIAGLRDVRWPARLEWLRHATTGARVLRRRGPQPGRGPSAGRSTSTTPSGRRSRW